MKLSTIILFFSFIYISTLSAQITKFGEISKQELESVSDIKFPEADAVVLYRKIESDVFNMVKVHERIKIYNEEGYEFSTIRIPYPEVFDLKGATYNLIDGKIVKTELDKHLIFTDEEIKDVKIKKFTFPRVQPGSVLEFTYKSENGTTANIDLQRDIPIKKMRVDVINTMDVEYNIIENPRAYLFVNRSVSGYTTKFSKDNIPALEKENYVYDMALYRSKLIFKLNRISNIVKLNTWKDVVELLFEGGEFARQLESKSFYKDEVRLVIKDETDKLKQVELLYNYLKKEIEWDKKYSIFPDKGTRDTFKKKEGDVADINILFISMLRYLEIEAYPVLASTKGNGAPILPGIEAFNYLIAAVKLNNEVYTFDVANNKSNFDMVPEILLNWQGLMINDEGTFSWVPINNNKISSKSVIAKIDLDDDLFMSGMAKERKTGYYSIKQKRYLKDLGENKIEDIVNYSYDGLDVSEVQIEDTDQSNMTNITYDIELDNAIDEISDKIYFSPLLYLSLMENPFKKESRKYAIDFGFPQKKQFLITINFPESYKVEFLPEPIKIVFENSLGSYSYRVSSSNNSIQAIVRFELNRALFPVDKYLEIKEFYKIRLEKENEKVVLVKK